jgi:hypothetical protein
MDLLDVMRMRGEHIDMDFLLDTLHVRGVVTPKCAASLNAHDEPMVLIVPLFRSSESGYQITGRGTEPDVWSDSSLGAVLRMR